VAITQSFDLVILDMLMRRMSGTQAAREIRAHKPSQQIILMSGIVSLAVEEFRETAADLGVHGLLMKPFERCTVREKVERALSQNVGRAPGGGVPFMANVIVVDDDSMVLDLLTNLIGRLGHKSWRARSTDEALALLAGPGHFDLVIIDLVMPGTPGIELAKQIRARYPSTGMIAMSGYLRSDSTDTIDALRAVGIREILHKPIDVLDFETAIFNSIRYHPPDATR
jgi:CheY-like chemotaxis protein